MCALRRIARIIWILPLLAVWLPLGPVIPRHAEAQGGGPAPAMVAEGHVIATTADAILISITLDRLPDLQNHDRLTVRIAGRPLTTRFFDAARYTALLSSPEAREGLDVDVVCTVDAGGGLVIVGLGGALTDWLGAKPRMRVVVEMP